MGRSLNRVMLIGRLGRDPEMKYTASGIGFCRFSVATDESWNDKQSGEKQTKTEWHNVVAWEKLAEICGQYLSKGSQVYLEGKLQTREWEDADGNKRKSTEIVLRDMTMLGDKKRNGGEVASPAASHESAGSGTNSQIDDDIPFRSRNPFWYTEWHENMPPVPGRETARRFLRSRPNGRWSS